MLSVERRALLSNRLTQTFNEEPMYKQASIEKVAEFRDYYGVWWPLALEKEASAAGHDELMKIAAIEKEALLGRLALGLLGRGRVAAGAVKSTAGRGLTRFGRQGGRADLLGQRLIRGGQQTKALGREHLLTAAKSKAVGLSPAMARVLRGSDGLTKAQIGRQAAKAGTTSARDITKKVTRARADASFKSNLVDKARAKGLVPGDKGALRHFSKAAPAGKRDVLTVAGRQKDGKIVRDIYGRATAHAAKRSGFAGATQKGLDAALGTPAAISSGVRRGGRGLKEAWNILSGKGRTPVAV